ncbi:MAG TPA: hypothetical protein VJ144_09690 [Candidatus Polarisedimenticolia bacterium]|nr:hypothetical protein [Candidatus Polarisedimenticolia bacterium]
MAETRGRAGADADVADAATHRRAGGPGEFDSDLDLRAIVTFGVCLALVLGVVLTIVWLLLGLFRIESLARDPRPSPLREENGPRLPPEPRLQPSPTADMETLRSEEDAILGSYGWVDRPAGIGRIPVERAIDILAATGLEPTPPTTPQVAAGGPTKTRRPRRPGPKP